MKHIFEIKDFSATNESAKHIMHDMIDVLLTAVDDIDILGINVFVNNVDTNFYDKDYSEYPIKFIPTIYAGKKEKKIEKQSFSAFHNFTVNAATPHINSKELYVHIIDGSLDLTDHPAEYKNNKTRIGEMINDVCDMMELLNHPVWFNTASDKGNMKFGHYYTAIDLINIDESCHLDAFPECVMYAGNTNLDWIIINGEEYKNKKLPSLMMNSEYFYDFLSIKQLIAKFVDFEAGYFDNMFPTIPTEVGAYMRNPKFDRDFQNYDMSKYKENVDKYKENLKEYENLKPATVNDVLLFVRNTVLPKLSKSDKSKIREFERLIQEGI